MKKGFNQLAREGQPAVMLTPKHGIKKGSVNGYYFFYYHNGWCKVPVRKGILHVSEQIIY